MSYSGRRLRADPFTDLLFNVLLSFTLLMFLAIIFMNPIPKTGVINPKAEYIITVSWADNNPDDIDTYVQNPTGGLVWFRSKESEFVHLDPMNVAQNMREGLDALWSLVEYDSFFSFSVLMQSPKTFLDVRTKNCDLIVRIDSKKILSFCSFCD